MSLLSNTAIKKILSETQTWTASQNYQDDAKLLFGESAGDLEVYHDGTNSYIKEDGTGDLIFLVDNKIIFKDDEDSDVTLFDFDTSGRTFVIGASDDEIATTLHGNVSFTGDLTFSNATPNILFSSGNDVSFQSNAGYRFRLDLNDNGDNNFTIADGGNTSILSLSESGNLHLNKNYSSGNGELRIGTGNQLRLLYNGSDSVIQSDSGDLYITTNVADKDIVFRTDGLTEYLRLDGSANNIPVSKALRMKDSVSLAFGDEDDVRMYFNGTTFIFDLDQVSQVPLNMDVGDFNIDTHGRFFIRDADDGDVVLFDFDTGTRTLTLGTATDDIYTSQYGYHRIVKDGSTSNNYFSVGAGDDLKIYHTSGGITYFYNTNGTIEMQSTTGDEMVFNQTNTSNNYKNFTFKNIPDGQSRETNIKIQANQYYNGTTNYDTQLIIGNHAEDTSVYGYLSAPVSASSSVVNTIKFYNSRTEFQANTRHQDNVSAIFGSSNDSQIIWDTNNMVIRSDSSVEVYLDDDQSVNPNASYFGMYDGDNNNIFKMNESGHLQLGLNSTSPQISLGSNGEYNAVILIGGDLNGNNSGTRTFTMGVDYSDHVFRLNAGSTFDGTLNGMLMDSSANVQFSGDIKYAIGTYIGTITGNTDHIRLLSSSTLFNRDTEHQDDIYAYFGNDEDSNIRWNQSDSLMEFNSDTHFRFKVDDDNNGTGWFYVNNGADTTVFAISETEASFPTGNGIRYAYNVSSNYDFTTAVTDSGITMSTASNTRDIIFNLGSSATQILRLADTLLTVGSTDNEIPLGIARYNNSGTYDDYGVIRPTFATGGIAIDTHNGSGYVKTLEVTKSQQVRLAIDGSSSAGYLSVGADHDLKIYHDGSNGYVDTTTGSLLMGDFTEIAVRDETVGGSGITSATDNYWNGSSWTTNSNNIALTLTTHYGSGVTNTTATDQDQINSMIQHHTQYQANFDNINVEFTNAVGSNTVNYSLYIYVRFAGADVLVNSFTSQTLTTDVNGATVTKTHTVGNYSWAGAGMTEDAKVKVRLNVNSITDGDVTINAVDVDVEGRLRIS